MLVLSRKIGESVVIELPDGRIVEAVVTDIEPDRLRCKLAIGAPEDVPIWRSELIKAPLGREHTPLKGHKSPFLSYTTKRKD